MAASVALLSAYQSARGCVHAELRAIVASFMAGLALGAGVAKRACGWGRGAPGLLPCPAARRFPCSGPGDRIELR